MLMTITLAGTAAAADFTKIKFPHDNPTVVNVINNTGAVAGQHGDGFAGRALIRAPDGKLTDFAVNGAVVTIPRGLTEEGAVGGRYDLPDDSIHGFLRDAAGILTPFDGPGLGAAEINGMNASNDIVGTYSRDQQQNLGGFIRHPDGSFTVFQVRGDRPSGLRIAGIDDAGEVAGSYSDSNFVRHAFLRNAAGKIAKFQAPDAATGSFGDGTDIIAISSNGWVTGRYTDNNGVSHHYLRNPRGQFEEFDLPGGQSNQTPAVNDNGEITGSYSANFQLHGFFRKPGGKPVTFDLPWGEPYLISVETLNDSGQIAGSAAYGSFGEKEFGFIRTP
jgi:hypothetical protein